MWFRFDIEQLASRNGKLMVVRGGRHFLLGGLSASDVATLMHTYAQADFLADDAVSPQALAALLKGQILAPAELTALAAHKATRQAQQRAWLPLLAYRLRHLGSAAGLVMLSLLSFLLCLHTHQAFKMQGIATLVQTAPVLHIALTVLTVLLTTAVHELGHATASCYYTGTVGRMRCRFIWGIPAVTVDVTSICLANRTGKIAISLAGVVFQLLISLILLASSDIAGVQAGACLGIVIALFNLLPLPLYDGYWLLVDLVGRPFQPRLRKANDRLEIVYGLALLLLFVSAAPFALRAIFSFYVQGSLMFATAPVRGIVLFVFCGGGAISVMMFAYSLLKSLLGTGRANRSS